MIYTPTVIFPSCSARNREQETIAAVLVSVLQVSLCYLNGQLNKFGVSTCTLLAGA